MMPKARNALLAMVEASWDSRDACNPYTEALKLLSVTLPTALCPDGGDVKEVQRTLLDEVSRPMMEDPDFSEASLKETAFQDGMWSVEVEAIGYCVLAIRAYEDGQEARAWTFVCDAKYWTGVIAVAAKRKPGNPAAELAKYRHMSTRKERAKVEGYWRENVKPAVSAQKAAELILMAGVTSLSHKKIAEIVSSLRKAEALRKD